MNETHFFGVLFRFEFYALDFILDVKTAIGAMAGAEIGQV
jgi:hypothetical protein